MPEIHLPHDHGLRLNKKLADMPDVGQFLAVSDLFKLLGDASRTRIFWVLCHCEACVINLSALVGMSSPAVSHHLRQLKGSGLVTSRREGKEVYYRAAATGPARLLHRTIERMMAIACPDGAGDAGGAGSAPGHAGRQAP